MNKAVFLDRDGVINELIHHKEQGLIDSPFTTTQFRLLPGISEAINKMKAQGYLIILVSNQPGIAKGYFSKRVFTQIRNKMIEELGRNGVSLDGEYYCFHHPDANIAKLKCNCNCRKPKPGMLLRAADEMEIDLSKSWMIGDNLSDIKAGIAAGCRTVLLGRMKCELCNLMEEECIKPNVIVPNLTKASQLILETRVDSLIVC